MRLICINLRKKIFALVSPPLGENREWWGQTHQSPLPPWSPPLGENSLIVGWVEVTKPFGDPLGNAQQAQKTCVGFRYRSTQPTNFYKIILYVAFFFRFYITCKISCTKVLHLLHHLCTKRKGHFSDRPLNC